MAFATRYDETYALLSGYLPITADDQLANQLPPNNQALHKMMAISLFMVSDCQLPIDSINMPEIADHSQYDLSGLVLSIPKEPFIVSMPYLSFSIKGIDALQS